MTLAPALQTVHAYHRSPLGDLLLTGDGHTLAGLTVPGQRAATGVRDDAAFPEVRRQLDAYFAGELHRFDLPLRTAGTAFREQVWRALDSVPFGETTTYGALAASIGLPRNAVRAVGGAVGANPLLIVRPCHRVVGADGSLTGFAGGLENKRLLLSLEGAR
ncbi:methylated-DNA--[protein]-cysteine S-methyltransferase [Streptomyces xiaopingdaonensis]|uniref:methylated-DNA--[protein]-cysteine S-methyltransferase n=1 Tax=Streptomyces xiaopingdaonensis TaxID=1565415 RepID=UPI00030298C8|nr:methylated-DNA--[protein]-cysteine S-methyltransferase [Streptomyces xiaopingdaonensis]